MSNYNKKAVTKWRKANPEKVRLNIKRWKQNNPEKDKAIALRYREKHREEAKQRSKIWRDTFPEKAKESHRKWYEHNKELSIKQSTAWRTAHPQKSQECSKNWLKSTNGRLARHARTDKRRRELGNNLLNNWFEGCNRHHVTKNDIICIPEELHKACKHNHKKPETMEAINISAWSYMEGSVL